MNIAVIYVILNLYNNDLHRLCGACCLESHLAGATGRMDSAVLEEIWM